MQNNPQLNFEKHTPESEISQASLAALEVMLAAVRNADFGLIPMFSDFNKPAQRYEEPRPELDSYDTIADFNAYRRRNAAAQPEQVAVTPETPDMLHEDEANELDRIRRAVDDVHAEMTHDADLAERQNVVSLDERRSFMNQRPNYGQDERYVA